MYMYNGRMLAKKLTKFLLVFEPFWLYKLVISGFGVIFSGKTMTIYLIQSFFITNRQISIQNDRHNSREFLM